MQAGETIGLALADAQARLADPVLGPRGAEQAGLRRRRLAAPFRGRPTPPSSRGE
jgi:hypothetical protein